MGADYSIDGNVVVLSCHERFNTRDLIDTLRAAMLDPDWHRPMRLLFDTSRSQESVSGEEIRNRVSLLVAVEDNFAKRLAVVAADPLHFGLARQGGSFAEFHGFKHGVFGDLAEARAWLLRDD